MFFRLILVDQMGVDQIGSLVTCNGPKNILWEFKVLHGGQISKIHKKCIFY